MHTVGEFRDLDGRARGELLSCCGGVVWVLMTMHSLRLAWQETSDPHNRYGSPEARIRF